MAKNFANSQTTATYADTVQKEMYPTKEQAIVLDAIEEVSIEDYCIAIGSIVQPKNVKYISRISQKRVCIYLSTQELAEKLVSENTKVKIRNYELTIRPLFSKVKRILLSNSSAYNTLVNH